MILALLLAVGALFVAGLLLISWTTRHTQHNSNLIRAVIPSSFDADIVRSSWCRGVLQKFGNACCPIFDYIVQQQQKMGPWGAVLDAGTGQHSLEWLTGLDTQSWTAVTGDPKRRKQLMTEFESVMRPECDRVVVGNWKDKDFLKGEKFNVIVADYLVGALDAFAPYFQYQLFQRLKRHLHAGGTLYVTGAEPLPDQHKSLQGQLVIDVWKARDAAILLTGERPYREYPMECILQFLKNAGFKVVGVGFFETTCTREYVERQLAVAESKLYKLREDRLAEPLQRYLDLLRERVRSTSFSFGNDYVVAAVLDDNSPDQGEITQDYGYSSPVLEQESIFPLDES